jgi:LPS O-antigen subunit length determinant protein (WzzB/FepE family)|tara:strand:- start:4190 stop:5197 length:1008 start_codon:yes stop_codon:yes gene_type:complete
MNQNKEFDFNFIDIVSLVWKYRKHLLIITLSAAILSAIFSSPFFITPKYESEVIFYPTTINSIGNAMFTDLTQRQADPLAFGEEEEAENALQLLNSSALQGRIVRNFDLINHYDIDTDGGSPQTDLGREMKSNIKFSRTRHLAVAINVLDEDPIKAAEIANGIGSLYDSVKTEIQRQVSLEALIIIQDEFKGKEKEVFGLRQKLQGLGKKGITNYEEQSRAIAEELYKVPANSATGRRLQAVQDKLAEYAGEFTYLNETLILELESLSKLRKRYEKAKVDVEKTLPQKFILTSASPAEKKTYPVRSLIVLLVTGAVGFFSVLVLLIMQQLGKLKK